MTADGSVVSRPLASLAPDDDDSDHTRPLHISGVSSADPRFASARKDAVRTQVARVASTAYRDIMPVLLLAAALVTAATLLPSVRRFLPPRQVAFAWASLVAAGSRLLLLAYLDATSIPSVAELYASPASPFVIGFAAVGCLMGWTLLRRRGGKVGWNGGAVSPSS